MESEIEFVKHHRSIGTIGNKAYQLNLHFIDWLDEEIKIIIENYAEIGAAGCHALIPRKGIIAIQQKATELNIKYRNSWSIEEDEILKKYFSIEGPACINRLPNHTKSTMLSRAAKLGLKFEYRIIFSKEEDLILINNYAELGPKYIHENLIMQKSQCMIARRAKELGLKFNPNFKWTEEEEIVLKTYYPIEGILCYKRFHNKTDREIEAAVTRLKLRSNSKNCPRNNKWTEQEDNIIKTFYTEEGPNIINRLPDRKWTAIRTRAAVLGIRAKCRLQRKVICVETNQVYNSVKEAEDICGHRLSDALNNGKRSGGYHWKYVESEE